ncbi:hypothetical protein QQZ08_008013 [Neonectria magnoliae]|uniref:Methyltransferase type 11 domain-containing protein n=1 Tax=Neonectria magnoliae TaxID=2732573 RepID=A0ABR1HXB3_9HYPO
MLDPSHWENDAAADDISDDDADSTLGDDAASSTASISSSILEYRVVHGRTYHASTLTTDGKLYLAPIDKTTLGKVLGVGTGTGIWPWTSAPRPKSSALTSRPSSRRGYPPNVKFEIENLTLGWTFADSSFDYMHMRYLYGSVPNWFDLYRRAYQVLKPGGWIES